MRLDRWHAVATSIALLCCEPLAHANRARPSGVAAAIDKYCLHCHSGALPKGGVSLDSLVEADGAAGTATLRSVRDRLQRRDMPPAGKDRPDEGTYLSLVDALNQAIDRRAEAASPGRPTLRRLNRIEYRNSVRDVTGIDVPAEAVLPADDVGEGFDHIGDVLSMSPVLLEKYFDLAERVALRAWPDAVEPRVDRRPGGDLEVRGGGRAHGDVAVVWSAGAAVAAFEAPRGGTYRIRLEVCGDQAGSEPVKVAVSVDRKRVAHFDVPERRDSPGTRSCEAALDAGKASIAVEFLNDFYDESLPQGRRDRNLLVRAITLEGPMDEAPPTAEVLSMAGASPSPLDFVAALLRRAYRRDVHEGECRAVLDRVLSALPDEAPFPLIARTAIVAALVDPRFLFRVEADPPDGAESRALDGFELATRLSYACWSAPPDDELLADAAAGALADEAGLLHALRRMLDDPRSLALAEHFGQQWLLIRAVETREPDPRLFEGVGPHLLADMKAETTLFVDRMLRDDRPIRELLLADWTFLNARLASHYGVPGVDGDWMRLVRVGSLRVPGVLGHGSVLVATSNPTRTSPVKRGKWVLEAIMDAPPPPPPPGVPVLPERGAPGGDGSMREMLARHRADPSCAACHARMDALGLALEPLDAVGRERLTIDGEPIDARATLPDGRAVDGPRELATVLANDPALIRSVVRHLYVYALGRGMTEEDEAIVDRMARSLEADASLRDVLEAIVVSKAFRWRAGPKEDVG